MYHPPGAQKKPAEMGLKTEEKQHLHHNNPYIGEYRKALNASGPYCPG
jgi:hypothetical protein